MKPRKRRKRDEVAMCSDAIMRSSLAQSLSVPHLIRHTIAQFASGHVVKCVIAHCSITNSFSDKNHFRWRCDRHRTDGECTRCRKNIVYNKLLFCQGRRCRRTLCLRCATAQEVALGYRCCVCFDPTTRLTELLERYQAIDEMYTETLLEIEQECNAYFSSQ